MWDARFGPRRRGTVVSVRPAHVFAHMEAGQTWNVGFALLHHNQMQHSQIGVNDATAHTFAFAFTVTQTTVLADTRLTLGQQQAYATRRQHSLLHREALLVVTTTDAHDISLHSHNSHARTNS